MALRFAPPFDVSSRILCSVSRLNSERIQNAPQPERSAGIGCVFSHVAHAYVWKSVHAFSDWSAGKSVKTAGVTCSDAANAARQQKSVVSAFVRSRQSTARCAAPQLR